MDAESETRLSNDILSLRDVYSEWSTHNGCRLRIPVFDARTPMMKGTNAEPA